MLTLFDSVKSLVRVRVIVTDNAVFQLHYRWTVVLLVVFSILVTLKQYWGEAIICKVDGGRQSLVEKFCWTETTFTIPSGYNETIGTHVAAPGVKNSNDDKTDRKYHAYYQWVGLTLFLQALLFCIPRFIWKSEEGGLVKNLVSGLECIISEEENYVQEKRLINYLKTSWRTHDIYVVKYIFCEICNFVNVVCQFILMEKFLGGQFSSYAVEMMGFKKDPYEISYALFPGYRVFPRMTKCIYYEYGHSGDINKKDILCLLPLNIIHEKIYVFLFIWFLILSTVSGIVIVLRIASILHFECREMALSSHARVCPKPTIRKICQHCSFFDWFFLKLVIKNVSSEHCKNIMDGIAADFNGLPYDKKYSATSTKTFDETIM